MQKRIKHRKRSADVKTERAFARAAIDCQYRSESLDSRRVPTAISEYMASIGRKGGKIGGKRRLSTLTEKERKRIASAAAKARWQKKQKTQS